MKNPFKEIHVVSNTHWDREFRFPFQKTRMLLVKMMDYLLGLLESDSSYISYTLDAHSILVEDYLEARPENRERIRKLVTERRLFIGPWFTLPDIPNISQESVVRNLLYGHKTSDAFGHTMKIGYTPCSWGQTGQLPQIYAGFGIDTILFYRGISPHECTSEFLWEAPDGTRALAHRFALFARYNYYYLVFRKITYDLDINDRQWWWGEHPETPFKNADADAEYAVIELLEPPVLYKKEKLKSALEGMLEIEGGQYFGPYFLAMHGHDISWPHPLEPGVVRDADGVLPETRVLQSDLEKYFDTLKKNLDLSKLPVLTGERRTNLKEGYWTYLLPGTISARTRLKKENFQTEMLLVHQAEPAAVFAFFLGEPYPSRYLDLAWRHLLCTHTHDANAGCAPDEVTQDVRYHLRQSGQISDELVQETLRFLARKVDTRDAAREDHFLLVFNPLPFERSELVELIIDLPEEGAAQSLSIRDPEGNICEYQQVSEEETGLFVDNPWNVPQAYISTRFRIKMAVSDVPAMGYKVYTVRGKKNPHPKTASLFTGDKRMENEYLSVAVENNGTVTLTDKKTGAIFRNLLSLEDGGEMGNAWRHEAPAQDKVVSPEAPARIRKIEDSPLSAAIRIDLSLFVPRDCPDNSHRSEEMVELPVTHFVTLSKYSKKVEVTTRFDNTARDHRLRVLFPTGLAGAETSCADSHFDVVERPIALPDCDDWKEPVVGTYPYRTFVDVSDGKKGLAILTEGLQEFEVLRDPGRTVALTLVRAVRIKLEVSEKRKQELPDPGPQCPGAHEFRIALYPHSGTWVKARCPKEALGFSVPLMAAQFGKNSGGRLPRVGGFFTCSNDRVEISAVKKAEKSDALIIRLFNPTDKPQKARLRFYSHLKTCRVVNLNEETMREIECDGDSIPLFLPPKKILTVEIE